MSILTDENSYILLPDDTRSYARMAGGYVEAMIRADSEAVWEASAEARFLLVRDEETDTLHPAPHVHIDGPMYPTITPAVVDAEGNVTTPAVLDTRPHYNLRIAPWAQEAMSETLPMPRWYETLVMFHTGTPITEQDRNKDEAGLYVSGITVLDPETISTPARVYA